MLDFTKAEIDVYNQEDLDSIPNEYTGRIFIKFGSPNNRAVVSKKFNYASVEACDNASVVARGNASVVAWNNASVVAWNNASVEAWGNASVEAWGNASVEAWGNASVVARDNASVVARGNASVEAWGNASVEAWGNASVEAWGNASVVAWNNASVEAWGNASVEAMGFSSVVRRSSSTKILTVDKARCVDPTENINTFMRYHCVKHTKTRSVWYKAVHKYAYDGSYHAEYNPNFIYEIGKTAEVKDVNPSAMETCGRGLHIASLSWAVNFGKEWDDLAILEVEVKTSDIVLPVNSDGKVRVPKLKVLREVRLEECGIYGKILARKKERKTNG